MVRTEAGKQRKQISNTFKEQSASGAARCAVGMLIPKNAFKNTRPCLGLKMLLRLRLRVQSLGFSKAAPKWWVHSAFK